MNAITLATKGIIGTEIQVKTNLVAVEKIQVLVDMEDPVINIEVNDVVIDIEVKDK